MASNDTNTTAGVALELTRDGYAQTEFFHYGVTEETNPCVAGIYRESKSAIVEEYVTPEGVDSAVASTTVRWCMPICQGYLLDLSISGTLTKVTTVQPDSWVFTDTLCYKDDAMFMLVNQSTLELGCSAQRLNVETGLMHKIWHDHFFNPHRRLRRMVQNGGQAERINWARQDQLVRVPLLYDFFLHPSKALRLWTMKHSPPRMFVQFNSMVCIR